ncbi:MAG: hypothetical protein U5K37_03915 [Natrialbaceae archaeon]|nr:hypothetical protein [Natrialbaceae archaeon]
MRLFRLSTIKYTLGMLIMLGTLAGFLLLFYYTRLDVTPDRFLEIIQGRLTDTVAGLPMTSILIGVALIIVLFIAWQLFGFGSMD